MTTTTANRIGRISHPSEVLPPPLPTFGGPRKGGVPYPDLSSFPSSLSLDNGIQGGGGKRYSKRRDKKEPSSFPAE